MNVLKRKLIIAGRVTVRGEWQPVLDIVEVMKSAKVIKKQWHDTWKKDNPDMYPLDLTEIDTWSTYAECVWLEFYLEKDKLMCEAMISDGSLTSGYPMKRRFTATLQLPMKFLPKIRRHIDEEFDGYCETAYEHRKREKRQAWIDRYKESILTDGGFV